MLPYNQHKQRVKQAHQMNQCDDGGCSEYMIFLDRKSVCATTCLASFHSNDRLQAHHASIQRQAQFIQRTYFVLGNMVQRLG